MSKIGTQFDRVCFTGLTGVPGVFVERGPGRWEFFGPEDCVGGFQVAGHRVICNVGAVGYPRDGDWRGCCVLFHGAALWVRRGGCGVPTNIRGTSAIPPLANPFW